MQPFAHNANDLFANTTIVPHNIVVCEAEDKKVISREKLGTNAVKFCAGRLIMLRTVQFDYELCFCAIKIRDILSENLLPSESRRVVAEKIIPQMTLLRCHFPAQLFCGRDKRCVVFSLHIAAPLCRKDILY